MYYIYISDCMSSCFASVPHLNSQGSSSFLFFFFLMEVSEMSFGLKLIYILAHDFLDLSPLFTTTCFFYFLIFL